MGILYEKSLTDSFFVSLVRNEKNKLFGIQHTSKRIYMIDLEQDEESMYLDIPDEDDGIMKLFQTAIKVNGKYFFIPFNSDNLVIMENDKLRSYNINDIVKCKNGKYMNAIINGKELILIPYSANKIIKVDIEKEIITKVINIKNFKDENDLF